jgi:hypothetical protein
LLHRVFRQLAEESGRFPVFCDALPFSKWPLGFLVMLLGRLLLEVRKAEILSASLTEELEGSLSRALGPEKNAVDWLAGSPGDSSPAQEQALFQLLERAVSEVASKRGGVVFLVDNLGESQTADFFRRSFSSLRDTLWTLEALFVVTIDAAEEANLLRPPVGAFFEVVVRLADFGHEEVAELLGSRGMSDPPLAARIYEVVRGNPRAVIDLARRLDLGEIRPDDLDDLIAKMGPEQGEDLDSRILRYLATQGAVSASDPDFQTAMNVSRTRLAQVLGKLSDDKVIQSSRHGKKVYYSLGSLSAPNQGGEDDSSATPEE